MVDPAEDGAAGEHGVSHPPQVPIQPHMISPLPPEMLPTMNWNAEDVPATWQRFKTRMQHFLRYTHCPKGEELCAILLYTGDEASNHWETLKFKCEDMIDVDKVWAVFDGSFEKSGTFWQYREEYLSDFRQGPNKTAAELDLSIRTLVTKCQFLEAERDRRRVDLLFHATKHYEVKKAIQDAKGDDLTFDKLIETAKKIERSKVESANYKGHFSRSQPPFQANAVSKRFQSQHRRQRRPSNGTCSKCGKSHDWGNCPAFGQKCYSCQGQNHYSFLCTATPRPSSSGHGGGRGRGQRGQHCGKGGDRARGPSQSPGRGRQSYSNRGRGGKSQRSSTPGRRGRGGRKKTYEVHLRRSAPDTVVNSVLAGGKAVSDGDVSLRDQGADKGQSVKLLKHRSKFNWFNCDAISGSGNGKMYTDTDSGGRTEIITHINVKSHAGSHNSQQMEVKVDPGAESNCMPLRHFRTMFPDWCDSTGRPKHGALGKSEAELEAYNGGAISILGWVALHLQHIEDKDEWIPRDSTS